MGQGGGQGTSTSTLYNWKKILPPWVQTGQQAVLPWLQSRAQTGLLPAEERALWGGMREGIESGYTGATKNLSRQMAVSGMNPSSPMMGGGFADLATDKMGATSKAALDFAKLKLGAKDTAIGQMLTALYTPPPFGVGSSSQQSFKSPK